MVTDSVFETNTAEHGAVLYADINNGGSLNIRSSKVETQTNLANARNGSLIYVSNHAKSLRSFKIVDSLIGHKNGHCGQTSGPEPWRVYKIIFVNLE